MLLLRLISLRMFKVTTECMILITFDDYKPDPDFLCIISCVVVSYGWKSWFFSFHLYFLIYLKDYCYYQIYKVHGRSLITSILLSLYWFFGEKKNHFYFYYYVSVHVFHCLSEKSKVWYEVMDGNKKKKWVAWENNATWKMRIDTD